MKEYQSLTHTRWDRKYHMVFIRKKRRKQIFWGVVQVSVRDIPRTCGVLGSEDCRRAHYVGSRAHVHQHSAEICGIERDGYIKGRVQLR